MKLEATVETDTGIGWWDENRRKFNVVVEAYNEWAMYGVRKADAEVAARALLMRLELLRTELEDSPFAHEPIERMKEAIQEGCKALEDLPPFLQSWRKAGALEITCRDPDHNSPEGCGNPDCWKH